MMYPIGVRSSGLGLVTQRRVEHAFQQLSETSLRMSTLKRINRGSDDPAGLVALEALNRELAALEEASAAADRARALVRVADSGLEAAGSLLNRVHADIVAGAGDAVSPEEKQALQFEIDAALDALNRVGSTTTFHGRQLLHGETLEFLAGPDPGNVTMLSLPEVDTGSLGSDDGLLEDIRAGGPASLNAGDPQLAVQILDAARSEILHARSDTGAFERYTIDANQRALAETTANLTAAVSQIEDADMAIESAELARALILADTSVQAARLTFSAWRSVGELLLQAT
jgi:flagellin